VARWSKCGLSVSGSFVRRRLTSQTMLRFDLPLIEPDAVHRGNGAIRKVGGPVSEAAWADTRMEEPEPFVRGGWMAVKRWTGVWSGGMTCFKFEGGIET